MTWGSSPVDGVYSDLQFLADCASLIVPPRQSRSARSRIARRVFCHRRFAATGFILVLVQKSGDLPAERRCFQHLVHGPGVSKISRCSDVGKVFHCMMTAAPRHRKTCSSSAARAAPRDRSFSATCTALL